MKVKTDILKNVRGAVVCPMIEESQVKVFSFCRFVFQAWGVLCTANSNAYTVCMHTCSLTKFFARTST